MRIYLFKENVLSFYFFIGPFVVSTIHLFFSEPEEETFKVFYELENNRRVYLSRKLRNAIVKGTLTAFVLDSDIPALLSKGALESLRGCLDFAQRTLTLGKTGKVIPLQMSEMGHYILSVADFPARVHSASLIQWTPLNQATQMMGLMRNGGFCWSEDPEPPPVASACKVVASREADNAEDSDSNSGILKLHINGDPALATQIKQVLVEVEGDTRSPPQYVDRVVSPWDTYHALANAPYFQISGTPTVYGFNERLQMDLLFPEDILALHIVERRIKLVSQGVGAPPWTLDRRNALACGVYNRLPEDRHHPILQLMVDLYGWDDQDDTLRFARGTPISGQLLRREQPRTSALEAARTEIINNTIWDIVGLGGTPGSPFPLLHVARYCARRQVEAPDSPKGLGAVDLPLAFEGELSKPLMIPAWNLVVPQTEALRARGCLKVVQAPDQPRYRGTVVMDPFWDSSRAALLGWMDTTTGPGELVPLSINLWAPVSPHAPDLAGSGTVPFERTGGDSVLTAGDSNRETRPRSMEFVPDSRSKHEVPLRVALVNDKDAASKVWVAPIFDRPGGSGISPDKESCFAWEATTAKTWGLATWGEFLVLSPDYSGIVAQDVVNTRRVLLGMDRAGERTVSVGLVTRGPQGSVLVAGPVDTLSCVRLRSPPLQATSFSSLKNWKMWSLDSTTVLLQLYPPLREFPLQDLSEWCPRAWCPNAPVYELNNAPVELEALFGRVPSWVMRNC